MPEPIFQWVIVRVLNMVGNWVQNRGTIRHLPFVGEESFRTAFRNLERDIAALLDAVGHLTKQEDPKWPREPIANLAASLEQSAHAFAAEVAGTRRAQVAVDRQLDMDSSDRHMAGVDEMAMAFLRDRALEVASAGLTIRAAMTAQTDASAPREPMSLERQALERVRRKRERERRGLRFMIPVNVYDGDLSLLREFGFLAGHQMSDRKAISRALETFLATGYLEHSAPKPDLEDRLQAQTGRFQDLTRTKVE
jgi:hypothetical protein